ncbi:MAG: hypothetical protein ABR568_22810, partial [Pyrinomonadaceae bacterium]
IALLKVEALGIDLATPLKEHKFAGREGRFTPACVIRSQLRLSVTNASGGKPPFPTCEFVHIECSRIDDLTILAGPRY